MRRVAVIGLGVLLVGLLWRLGLRSDSPERWPAGADKPKSAGPISAGSTSPSGGKHGADLPLLNAETLATDFPIVAPLNRADSTLARDLETVALVLDAWRTNFPGQGNPFGENSEITAALAGDNSLGLVLIPRQHPAINAAGELCDRWGTPFRFHQISGQHMEIRSAGPDRAFATGDDAIWNPAP